MGDPVVNKMDVPPANLAPIGESRVLTPLCELAVKHCVDKGGWHTLAGCVCHNYTPVYHSMFGHRRDSVRRVLEVGVNHGASIRMWKEYFPNAEIFGVDIRPECLFQEDRIKCFQGDQSNPDSLRAAVGKAGKGLFDLIIDDGSHVRQHQVITANTLIEFLSETGSYITEDLAGPDNAEITCRPDLLAAEMSIPSGYIWGGLYAGIGLGNARCKPKCPYCKGAIGEYLLEISRRTSLRVEAIPTFCINLPDAKSRWKAIQAQARAYGITIQRWEASTPDQVTGNYFEDLTKGQRACTHSHLRLFRHALERETGECVFILEDDAKFRNDWLPTLNGFLAVLSERDPDWDAVFLNVSEEIYPLHTWLPIKRQCSTGGYIIHRRGIEFILQNFAQKWHCIDWMTQVLQERGHTYSIFPWLVIQDGSPSSVQSSDKANADQEKMVRLLGEAKYDLSNYDCPQQP